MNKTVLITGGTGKLGKVLVRHFVGRGWRVVTTSREQSRLENLVASVGASENQVMGIAVDLRESSASNLLIEELAARKLAITHLVNNARSIETLVVEPGGQTGRDNFVNEFEMDVVVPYELSMCLARSRNHILKSVVNIGSMYGEVAPNPALYEGTLERSPIQYGVSKSALHHLTRELAIRFSQKQIRVNCVAFGGVEGRVDEAFRERYAQLVPSRRMLRESEISGPVEFLLSDASKAVNGHVLLADGGWTLW